MGIEDNSIFWSIGPYAEVLIFLAMIYIFYYLITILVRLCHCLKGFAGFLKKILFYSACIRFLIEGYLTITHNAIFYLSLKASFSSTESSVQTCFGLLCLLLILVWPIYLTIFLLASREKHEYRYFLRKFSSMYLTNKSDRYVNGYFFRNHAMSFLYTVWFCLRRFAFVMCFFITYNDAMIQYQCLLCLLLV